MKKAVAIAAAVLFAATLWTGCRYWADNRAANFSREYTLYVYPDSDAAAVLDSVSTGAGAIRRGSLDRCARKEDLEGRMKPGKYLIGPSESAVKVVRKLCNGWQTPHRLTLSGTIRSRERLAGMIGRQMMADSLSIDSLLRSDAFLSEYGFTSENVFALILPDTYEMYWTASPGEIFARFKKEYDAFWTAERLEKAAKQGLSKEQVSVLASIVSGETLKSFEYPVIAGVYLNRLRKGMKLQADPTVAYCYGYTLDRILRAHLSVDSPYNTYKYAGLPPAPINVPPKACIDAVLNPERHDYIFFCASPAFDGTHRFAVGYAEHSRNAREFQRALTERRKARSAS